MDAILKLITYFNLALFAFVAIVVVRRGWKTKSQRRFFWVLFFGFFWILNSFLEELANVGFEKTLAYWNFAIAACIAGAMASFAIHYPDQNKKLSIKKEILLQLPIIILAGLSFTNLIVRPISFKESSHAPLYPVYYIVIAIYFLIIALGTLIKKCLSARGVQRAQLLYFLAGYLVAITTQLCESFYVNRIGGISITTDRLVLNVVIFFVAISSFAIIKYRFLDIRLSFQRGLTRLLTFGILFGFFAYVLLFLQQNVQSTQEKDTALLVVVVFIVLVVEPLRRFVFRFVDKLFDNQEKKRQDALQRIQLVASSTLQFTSLVERLTLELRNVFGVNVHFLLRDEQHGKLAGATELSLKDPIAGQIVDGKVIITDELPYRIENGEAMLAPLHGWLQQNKVSAVLPIGNREDFVGAFLFHDGQGSEPFTTDRVEFLKRFRNQVQFAFASAYAYKLAVERISIQSL